MWLWDFPGSAVLKNPPAYVDTGDTGTQVRSFVGKIPHAMEQLSLCTTTTEPML